MILALLWSERQVAVAILAPFNYGLSRVWTIEKAIRSSRLAALVVVVVVYRASLLPRLRIPSKAKAQEESSRRSKPSSSKHH